MSLAFKDKLLSFVGGSKRKYFQSTETVGGDVALQKVTSSRKMSDKEENERFAINNLLSDSSTREKNSDKKEQIDELSSEEEDLLNGGLVDLGAAVANLENQSSPKSFTVDPSAALTSQTTMNRLSKNQSKVMFQDSVRSATTSSNNILKKTKSIVTVANTIRSDYFGVEENLAEFQWDDSPTFHVPTECCIEYSSVRLMKLLKDTPFTTLYLAEIRSPSIEMRFKFTQDNRVYLKIVKETSNNASLSEKRRFLTELAILSTFNTKKKRYRIVPKLIGLICGPGTSENPFENIDKNSINYALITNVYSINLKSFVSNQTLVISEGDLQGSVSLKKSRLHDIRKDVRILQQLASALQELHAENIFHHAINPDNILLSFEENFELKPLLANFEHAQILGTCYKPEVSRVDMNDSNSLFISPELRKIINRNKEKRERKRLKKLVYALFVDEEDDYETAQWLSKSDCFSFGMVANYLFETRIPYHGLSIEDVIKAYSENIMPSWKITKLRFERFENIDDFIGIFEGCLSTNHNVRPDFAFLSKATNFVFQRVDQKDTASLAIKLKNDYRRMASKS